MLNKKNSKKYLVFGDILHYNFSIMIHFVQYEIIILYTTFHWVYMLSFKAFTIGLFSVCSPQV